MKRTKFRWDRHRQTEFDMKMKFPRWLYSTRKLLGLSQQSVAITLGVSQGLIGHYESGIRKPKDPASIKLIINEKYKEEITRRKIPKAVTISKDEWNEMYKELAQSAIVTTESHNEVEADKLPFTDLEDYA